MTRLWILSVAWVVCACNGTIGDPAAETDIPRGGCRGEACVGLEESPPPSYRFVRLTHAQWENTVQALFRASEPFGLSRDFIGDPPGVAAFDTDERRLGMTPELWQDYQQAAETVAEAVTRDDAELSRWLPAVDGSVDAFVRDFGFHAFRRPLASTKIEAYVSLAAGASGFHPDMDPFAASVRLVVEAMLQSPHFMFRAERSEEASGGVIPLDDFELATRLSYFVWDSMPDAALLEAAAAGVLSDPEGLRGEAERLLDDDQAHARLARFHDQLYGIASWSMQTHALPEWRDELADMMQDEVRLFLDHVVWGDGTIGDLLTSRTAYLNEDLASFYGVSGVTGPELREVELDSGERAGLLTRLGVLTTNKDEPPTIQRGVFIARRILCRRLGEPPDNAAEMAPPAVGETNRERVESQTDTSCARGCHESIINPLGFGLEAYDALGRFRTEDEGHPIDDAATYGAEDGSEIAFDGAVDLSSALAAREETHRCYTTRLLEFELGRGISDGDSPWIYRAVESSRSGSPIRDLVLALVTSRSFRTRSVAELELAVVPDATETEESP